MRRKTLKTHCIRRTTKHKIAPTLSNRCHLPFPNHTPSENVLLPPLSSPAPSPRLAPSALVSVPPCFAPRARSSPLPARPLPARIARLPLPARHPSPVTAAPFAVAQSPMAMPSSQCPVRRSLAPGSPSLVRRCSVAVACSPLCFSSCPRVLQLLPSGAQRTCERRGGSAQDYRTRRGPRA